MARAFSVMFLVVAASLALLSLTEFAIALMGSAGEEMISGIVRALNTAFISLATFELGVGIGKEYALPDQGLDLFPAIRRTITRFVSVVCIAMALEALIMVIEYSQLELPGNLYYPVAVTAGASLLLVSLAVFIHLTRKDVPGGSAVPANEERGLERNPAAGEPRPPRMRATPA